MTRETWGRGNYRSQAQTHGNRMWTELKAKWRLAKWSRKGSRTGAEVREGVKEAAGPSKEPHW